MPSECRKMHNFASRFGIFSRGDRKMHNFASSVGKCSRGDTPNPHWGRAQAASTSGPLGIFSKKHSFSSKFLKRISVEQMHSECRKMHHFAFRFGNFFQEWHPEPNLGRDTSCYWSISGPLRIFTQKSTIFHLEFTTRKKEFQWKMHSECRKITISHLDLEKFPGVKPQTPFGMGHKLLAYQGF